MQKRTEVVALPGIDRRAMMIALMALSILAVAGAAFALNGGSTTGVGGDLYDLIVNKFIKGPIGAAAGTGFIVVGSVMAVMGKISGAIWPLIGGGLLASASNLATSLGLVF